MTHISLESSPRSCFQVAFPKLKVECVDLELMVERQREEEMKALFGYQFAEGTVIELVRIISEIYSQNLLHTITFSPSQRMELPSYCQP